MSTDLMDKILEDKKEKNPKTYESSSKSKSKRIYIIKDITSEGYKNKDNWRF